MNIKRGTVKKLCNARRWPDDVIVITPPVYDEDYPDAVEQDCRGGYDHLTPAQWSGAAKMYPDALSSGHCLPPSYLGSKIYFAAVFPFLWVKNLGSDRGAVIPGVQTEFQDLHLWQCCPWTGQWPLEPPVSTTLFHVWTYLTFEQQLAYDFTPAQLPYIYALGISGDEKYVTPGGSQTANYSWLQVAGAPRIEHFSP